MHLSEQEFWLLTMREFNELCKRKQLNDRQVESYSAKIAWLLYNINCGKDNTKPMSDFMSPDPGKIHMKQSTEDMKRIVRSITEASKGTIQ